jgi:hypothetical protein
MTPPPTITTRAVDLTSVPPGLEPPIINARTHRFAWSADVETPRPRIG